MGQLPGMKWLEAFKVYHRHRRLIVILVVKHIVGARFRPENSHISKGTDSSQNLPVDELFPFGRCIGPSLLQRLSLHFGED